jgi:hypothetical protein
MPEPGSARSGQTERAGCHGKKVQLPSLAVDLF